MIKHDQAIPVFSLRTLSHSPQVSCTRDGTSKQTSIQKWNAPSLQVHARMLVFKAVVDTNHLRIPLVVAKDITVEKTRSYGTSAVQVLHHQPDHIFGTAKRCAPRSLQWQAVTSSDKQWQTVASVKEGDKAMEIGMNEVLIQSGSQIDVYSFGQGSSRNEYFLHMAIKLGKLRYAVPVSFQHQTSLTRPTRCLPAVCASNLICPLISVRFQFT